MTGFVPRSFASSIATVAVAVVATARFIGLQGGFAWELFRLAGIVCVRCLMLKTNCFAYVFN